MYDFLADLTALQTRINQYLTQQLTLPQTQPSPLAEAMQYGVLLGGKRVRPFLVYATGRMFHSDLTSLDSAAAAIECIHSYSLIHDDLPAMDNDTLRRNKPTCHIAFDEATAILAADALQAFAFELLTNSPLPAQQQLKQVRILAQASGVQGMCLGQSLDLISEQKQVSLTELERIHQNKTGALITAAVQMGFYASSYFADKKIEQYLIDYAQAIGLAFQVQDDILDITASSAELGKDAGSDLVADKSTYPKLLGLAQAKTKALQLQQSAVQKLEDLSEYMQGKIDTSALKALAHFIITRKN